VFLISPKSCLKPWSESGDRELVLEELTRGVVHPELPRLDRSDRCVPFVGFASGELLDSLCFGGVFV
jgi:hypothetical protein